MNTEVALPPDIHEICEGRDAAIAAWIELHQAHHAGMRAANGLMIGAAIGISGGSGFRPYDERDQVSPAFLAPDEAAFAKSLRAEVDRRCWDALCKRLSFDELMDRQAREEFAATLRDDPPEFTPDNCRATFGHLWGNRREIYLRGIANVFAALDRRFRSHDGFKIGSRLIIERALSEWGTWNRYDRRDTLSDVERVFREIDPDWNGEGESIVDAVLATREAEGTPSVAQGRYFRVRIFGNGNLHIWFENEALLREVNLMLAEYYGESIGDGYDSTEADDDPEYHSTPAKRFGEFFTSDAVADRLMQMAEPYKGDRILEPSAGSGQLARRAAERGATVQAIEIQPGLAYELRKVHGIDAIEADFLTCDPAAMGEFDMILMNPPFDRGRDCDHVRHAWKFLRPGGKLFAIMSARAEYGTDKRHKALHRLIDDAEAAYGWMKWHDLPPGSFSHAGTNVNTTILALRKPALRN